jgi:hypothetical protein
VKNSEPLAVIFVEEAFFMVKRESAFENVKFALPPERVAGVPDVEVQKGTSVAVSAEDVATLPVPPEPPEAEIVIGVEPRIVKDVHEAEPEHETVVVGTLVIWLPEVTSAIWPFVQGEVVERPLNAIVPVVVMVPPVIGQVVAMEETEAFDVLQVGQAKLPPAPPTCAPNVPENVMGDETPKEDVATLNTPAPPPDSRSCPETRLEVVAMPAQVMLGVVPPEEKRGGVAVTDVTPPIVQVAQAITPVEGE